MYSNIFKILETSHTDFLQPYSPPSPPTSILQDCEVMLNKLHNIYSTILAKDEENRHNSASKIVNFLKIVRNKKEFRQVKVTLKELQSRQRIGSLLKLVDDPRAAIYEKSMWTVIFRLAGPEFPPKIVYKLVCGTAHVSVPTCVSSDQWREFRVFRCSACKTRVRTKVARINKVKRKKMWINEVYYKVF